MLIIGLTGSIGMGKSTIAAMLRRMHIPVYCADEAAHHLMARGGAAVATIAALHPPCYDAGQNAINRNILGDAVFKDAALLKKLEHIIHPLIRKEEQRFLKRHRAMRSRLVVLDIPLLFETHRAKDMDKIMVVHAPLFIQRQRVLSRPNMTLQKFHAILRKQCPDYIKRQRADILIPTGLGKSHSFKALKQKIAKLPNSY